MRSLMAEQCRQYEATGTRWLNEGTAGTNAKRRSYYCSGAVDRRVGAFVGRYASIAHAWSLLPASFRHGTGGAPQANRAIQKSRRLPASSSQFWPRQDGRPTSAGALETSALKTAVACETSTSRAMPSYHYHLKFELYPCPDPAASGASKASQTTREIWLPPTDASVFDDLPSHPRPKPPTAEGDGLLRAHPRPPPDSAPGAIRDSVPQVPKRRVIDCGAPRAPIQDDRRNVEVLSEAQWLERTRALPPPRSDCAIAPQTAVKDWRFGRVSIETVDPAACADAMSAEAASKVGPSAAPSLEPSFGGVGTATRAEFLPRETKNTELGWGVVHFYRDGEESSPLDAPEGEAASTADGSSTLCIPAVPAYMTPGDLIGFFGDRWMSDMSHCRMVMTSRMNRYLVLLKFRDGERATRWRREFDGKVFNSMEVSPTGSCPAPLRGLAPWC